MTAMVGSSEPDNVVSLQERRLDRTLLRTYRTTADIDEVVPNNNQPRVGAKTDEELQRQIESNGGLSEPLLVEPHPEFPRRFRVIDGDRRWATSRLLVEQGKDEYRRVPIEVTDRTLSEEDRLRVWVYIHRQRKEWDAKEKEMAAYRLVDMMGRASAANILGISLRELDKLVEIFELSQKFKSLRDSGAAITWARELMGVSKRLLTPSVIDAVVKKVNERRITNSKDLRKLRTVLPDPVAHDHFLSDQGDIESAVLRIKSVAKPTAHGLVGDLDTLIASMRDVPWATLHDLKGDSGILKKIADAEELLRSLRKALG
jgi:ParB family chromosome partitioning protein